MKKQMLILPILLLGIVFCRAQKQDQMESLKLFMKVCNNYKQLPVQVDMDIVNTCNYLMDEGDTGHVQARFVLCKEGTYIGYGEIEQIANDSMLLLVSARMKRILVYSHPNTIAGQLKNSIGWQLKDSSLERLATRYFVGMSVIAKDTAEIEIIGKTMVRQTDVPREAIRVRYDPVSLQPYEIRQTKRSLVPISAESYRELSARADGSLLLQKDSSYYIVREQVSVYRYDRISHQENGALPVTVADRIRKDNEGNYRPVSKYEGYGVSKEL
ncbi:MAG: hypothetical protein JST68_20510 [Bacteroidetes bacterium]|nr:hypothetical protein [Bacteroidota bacterium]